MIDRNSRPAITAVSRRDPRATLPPPWAPSHPLGIQTQRAVVTNGSGTQQSRGGAGLRQPTRSSQWHVTWHEKVECRPGRVQGSPPDPGTRMGWGAALAPGPPASVCVMASRRCHSPIRRGLLPCDSAAFLLWGQRNLGLTKERARGGSGGRLWGSADQ